MKIKKALSVIIAAAMATSCLGFAACTPRDEVLKIYNWGDYINEDLIGVFEDWYKTETGKNITVQYDTFDTNETMLMRIETQKADYDLVCPSEYVAERMINSKLAKKLNKDIFDIDMDTAFYEGLADTIKPFDAHNEYFVPYEWGTFGIMYDTDHITPGSDECKSWSALWSRDWEKNTGKRRVLMKDSVRDAYSVALLYQNRDALYAASEGFTNYHTEEYQSLLTSFYSNVTAKSIEAAQKTLVAQKPAVYKYEVDNGKEDMLAGTTDAWLAFLWSCDVLLVMIDGGGDHFYYEVPEEGSNVWLDGWIIPKYAKNEKAANYFLKFINTHEYAKKNFEYLGATLPLRSVMDEVREEIEAETTTGETDWKEFFDSFDPDYRNEFKAMLIDTLFPPAEVLARCGVMRDCGLKKSVDLASMWIDVKTY
ncbi:MAG: extracellular solute-binding protein [Clostridiales bacterium]|nr:extracellular solute-binding protein [Clostridiales bacterium]